MMYTMPVPDETVLELPIDQLALLVLHRESESGSLSRYNVLNGASQMSRFD